MAVVRFAPVSVPRFLTACLLAILCGSRPSLMRFATALEEAIKAVKAQAEKDCGPCCKSITVTVQCPGEAGGLDFQALTSRLNKPVLCGKTYTYDCKEKKWK